MAADEKERTGLPLRMLLPHVLVFGGIALAWLGVDPNGRVMAAGFILYGLSAFAESVKRKYHRRFALSALKPAAQLLIVVVAVNYMITGLYFIALLVLALPDNLVLTTSQVESFSAEKDRHAGNNDP